MGKQHGSLARSGKVKGQTPKVDKADKRKQPRGRAKKRMQFNRRFSTKVTAPGGGPKKGPNTQASGKY
jgi:small subunit ribosomal protein S30e